MSAMSAMWRVITAALFATHLLVGCCSHHAHACDDAMHSLATADNSASHGECPRGPQDCKGYKCSFVLPGRPVIDWLGQPAQAASASSLAGLPSPAVAGQQESFLTSGRLSLPVRLHLANQVLLI